MGRAWEGVPLNYSKSELELGKKIFGGSIVQERNKIYVGNVDVIARVSDKGVTGPV
jgi:hypothetical protein